MTSRNKQHDLKCPAAENIGWHIFDYPEVVSEDKPDLHTTITTLTETCRNCGYTRLWQRERNNWLPFLVSDDTEVIFLKENTDDTSTQD